ncbi:MAG TPA: hypothetical protein DIW20_05610 [Rhodospirillaceae bacterium]|nr:hypothetical protein [Rhodospirillaceae bacterium]
MIAVWIQNVLHAACQTKNAAFSAPHTNALARFATGREKTCALCKTLLVLLQYNLELYAEKRAR